MKTSTRNKDRAVQTPPGFGFVSDEGERVIVRCFKCDTALTVHRDNLFDAIDRKITLHCPTCFPQLPYKTVPAIAEAEAFVPPQGVPRFSGLNVRDPELVKEYGAKPGPAAGPFFAQVQPADAVDGDFLPADPSVRRCRVCGCTDEDCSQCIAKTGVPCHWVDKDLCSACEPPPEPFLEKRHARKKQRAPRADAVESVTHQARRRAGVRPERKKNLAPTTDSQRSILAEFDRGNFDLMAIGKASGTSGAYAEKLYFKNWLTPKLLAACEEAAAFIERDYTKNCLAEGYFGDVLPVLNRVLAALGRPPIVLKEKPGAHR